MRSSLALQALITVIAILLAAPMIAVIAALLTGGPGVGDALFGMARQYGPNTFALMVSVALLTGIIGTGCAWIISVTEFPGRRILSWMLVLPIAAPSYVIAYLYTDILEFSGPVQTWLRATFSSGEPLPWFPQVRSLPGAALMLSLVLYPYVYVLARASFAARGRTLWMAARSLGASPGTSFWRVALPTARPAIAGGIALVTMETLADYGVADYFAIPTFSTGIFRTWLAMGDKALALQLAALMLMVVFLLVILESSTRRGRQDDGTTPTGQPVSMALTGAHAALALLCCAVPVALGFIIPVGYLLFLTVTSGDVIGVTALSGFAGNSLVTALVVSGIASVLAIVMAYAVRSKPSILVKSSVRISTLGYALPGALLAVGLLAPVGKIDQALTRGLHDTVGWSGGLILTGTMAALCFALVIRFLTVAYNGTTAGLAQISPTIDGAARSLGATPARVIRDIHFPLMSRSIAAGAILVFIDVLRELPATLILRPFNYETLATRVYRLASDERLAEASTSALIIVSFGLVAVVLLNGVAGGPRQRPQNNAS